MGKISTVQARNLFSEVINRAAFGKERVILTRRGKDIAAVVPIEDVSHLERARQQQPPGPERYSEERTQGEKPIKAKEVKGPYQLAEENRDILKRALWDLNLTPEEFLKVIEGKSDRSWPSRGFSVARLLESVNWFDVVKIIDPSVICRLWEEARKYVRTKSIQEGMDFACEVLS